MHVDFSAGNKSWGDISWATIYPFIKLTVNDSCMGSGCVLHQIIQKRDHCEQRDVDPHPPSATGECFNDRFSATASCFWSAD